MKILVFADFHGSLAALSDAVAISQREKPNKTVICGDLFGWSNVGDVANMVESLEGVLYLVKGNNDFATAASVLKTEMEDNALMYHFGRTLFFTHGDRYNAMRVPPFLKEGDALIYGHTHVGQLRCFRGIYALNVGSLARARDGVPCYMTLDEQGATLKSPDGNSLCQLDWN